MVSDAAGHEPAPTASSRKLWVRWAKLVVFVIVVAILFINLGQWQLRRLAQREARNAVTVANEQAPIQPYEQVFNQVLSDAQQWQRVRATGTFDPDHQFLIRNRNNGDDRGYELVTPLHTKSGTVLVDRGFVVVPPGTGIPSAGPPPPTGTVTVVGYAHQSEHGRSAAITPVAGAMRLVNSDAIQSTLGYPIANGYIAATSVSPSQTGGLAPIALPELSNGPHFWYAMQWFAFTLIGLIGFVVLIRSDLRDRKQPPRPQVTPTPAKTR